MLIIRTTCCHTLLVLLIAFASVQALLAHEEGVARRQRGSGNGVSVGTGRKLHLAEVGADSWNHTSTACDPVALGNPNACADPGIQAVGNTDYLWGAPEVAYPQDGTPYGINIKGPWPGATGNSATYLLSWLSGPSQTGPADSLRNDTAGMQATVTMSTQQGFSTTSSPLKSFFCVLGLLGHFGPCGMSLRVKTFTGSVVRYIRSYDKDGPLYQYSYLSPYISHVLVHGLEPRTRYYYTVSNGLGPTPTSREHSFLTLPPPRSQTADAPKSVFGKPIASDDSFVADENGNIISTGSSSSSGSSSRRSHGLGVQASLPSYPLRIGLLGDIGQTHNSSATRDHLIANDPHVVFFVGDYSYSDAYSANSANFDGTGGGTNQIRWDVFQRLWAPLFSRVPHMPAIGNHEIEAASINARIDSTTTTFAYPTNFPFQAVSARFPFPGVTSAWGDISQNLYYATEAGPVKLVVLNNYVPFGPGTPQYEFAKRELLTVDRTATPWLMVTVHAAPYHTYVVHYKEMDCWLSIYEDMMYEAGVDFVLSGHVHAYERTHPVYQYQPDTCAPMYVGIGDGGNIEGLYRAFIDDIDPATGKSYCEGLQGPGGVPPNKLAETDVTSWGPWYQRVVHPPNCNTLSFQPAGSVKAGPVFLPLANTSSSSRGTPLGFCQFSQPDWSAHRDPSFGHAVLELQSDTRAVLKWYRNIDGQAEVRDSTHVERLTSCTARRRRGRRQA